MLSIVGGSYLEYCLFPQWSHFYGSGLRAAIALSELSHSINFHTVVSEDHKSSLQLYSKQFGFNLEYSLRSKSISFNYLHPLSDPFISPSNISDSDKPSLVIKDRNILQFGMLDANVKVNGEKVVYDPQSPGNPIRFHRNGSKAKELVYVANLNESRILSNRSSVESMGKFFLSQRNTKGVIIKCDSRGLYVFTKRGNWFIPPFETQSVWTLGSGDIFSACFAYHWCELGTSILKSARKASYYTAYYCLTRVLPLPRSRKIKYNFKPKLSQLRNLKIKGQVYLAGPFFSIHQLWFINEIRNILNRKNINVFSPYHDVGFGVAEKVVAKDLRAIEKSKVIFAILDGMDTGTIFEIGYARSLNIPVIVYAQVIPKRDLTMLIGTDCHIFNDLTTAVYNLSFIVFGRTGFNSTTILEETRSLFPYKLWSKRI
jgi:hypothetical protein